MPMTTLVAITSKHAVVMGSDSLGTTSKYLVDPTDLVQYFDPANGWKLKMGNDGLPLLQDIGKVMSVSQDTPYRQLLHVNKLVHLRPLPIGVMFTGVVGIGTRSIRSLIEEFSDSDLLTTGNMAMLGAVPYTVTEIAQHLLTFLRSRYEAVFVNPLQKPALELLVGGYDHNQRLPCMCRIDIQQNTFHVDFPSGQFGASFGGQRDWIDPIIFGLNGTNRIKMIQRVNNLLIEYRRLIQEEVNRAGITFTIPEPTSFGNTLELFNNFALNGLTADWAEMTEQNAIDAVDFLIEIMIRSQSVSSTIPTVGGDVHVAVIRRDGFHLVSTEVWKHRENIVDVPEVRDE